jgi:hypothetical protein
VLDPVSITALHCPEGGPARVELSVQTPNRVLGCEVAAKAIRKAQAAIREHGTDGVACLIQGRLGASDTPRLG